MASSHSVLDQLCYIGTGTVRSLAADDIGVEMQAFERDQKIFSLISHSVEQLMLSWILHTTLPHFIQDNGRNHEYLYIIIIFIT